MMSSFQVNDIMKPVLMSQPHGLQISSQRYTCPFNNLGKINFLQNPC